MQNPEWNPAELLKMSGSYWSACALHAGVKLDLFTPLAAAPATAAELSARLGFDLRGLAMLLDALAALGLLAKEGDAYRAVPFAVRHLDATAPGYLGHIIKHHHHLVESWARLDQSVRTGEPNRRRVSHDAGEEERESFLLGMFNLASMLAPRVAERVDLSGRRHLLDLGGGPGTYAIHFCRRNPQLRATIFDLPTTGPFAEATVRRFDLQERIGFVGGDFLVDPLPGCYDAAWLSHVLHGEGSEACVQMLAKASGALEAGGELLIQEFILEDSRDRPLFPALFSLNMLVGTTRGQAYSEGELRLLMAAAGLEGVERLQVDLPNGAGVLRARKPG